MKNRAKCRLCKAVIESFHDTDYVVCICGEIVVDGGSAMRCAANDWDNFLRVDDEGNEISIKVQNLDNVKPLDKADKPDRKELLGILEQMADNIEKMPPEAMQTPITHFDYWSLLVLLSEILREDCKADI